MNIDEPLPPRHYRLAVLVAPATAGDDPHYLTAGRFDTVDPDEIEQVIEATGYRLSSFSDTLTADGNPAHLASIPISAVLGAETGGLSPDAFVMLAAIQDAAREGAMVFAGHSPYCFFVVTPPR